MPTPGRRLSETGETILCTVTGKHLFAFRKRRIKAVGHTGSSYFFCFPKYARISENRIKAPKRAT